MELHIYMACPPVDDTHSSQLKKLMQLFKMNVSLLVLYSLIFLALLVQLNGKTSFKITDQRCNPSSKSSVVPTSYCACVAGQLDEKI